MWSFKNSWYVAGHKRENFTNTAESSKQTMSDFILKLELKNTYFLFILTLQLQYP